MKRSIRLGLIILVALFAFIQLFQPNRDNPPVRSELDAPPEVTAVLRRACYDCHSNETTWPWYSHVNPFGWLVAGHVNEGRAHLNFSEWASLDAQKRMHAREEILEVLTEGSMPLPSYLLLHGTAKLSVEDVATLTRWANDAPAATTPPVTEQPPVTE